MINKSIFDKFDEQFDTQSLREDVVNSSSGTFKEVPDGSYEVEIIKLELGESKAGDPMVSARFKVLAGEYKNSLIFMNQVIKQGFQIHIMNEFLRSLDSGIEIEFVKFSQYANVLADVFEAISGQFEYGLEYSHNAKGFPSYDISEIFEVE